MKLDIREIFLISELENTFKRLMLENSFQETERLKKHLNWIEAELMNLNQEASND